VEFKQVFCEKFCKTLISEHRTSVEFKLRSTTTSYGDGTSEHRTSVEFKHEFSNKQDSASTGEHRTSVEFKQRLTKVNRENY